MKTLIYFILFFQFLYSQSQDLYDIKWGNPIAVPSISVQNKYVGVNPYSKGGFVFLRENKEIDLTDSLCNVYETIDLEGFVNEKECVLLDVVSNKKKILCLFFDIEKKNLKSYSYDVKIKAVNKDDEMIIAENIPFYPRLIFSNDRSKIILLSSGKDDGYSCFEAVAFDPYFNKIWNIFVKEENRYINHNCFLLSDEGNLYYDSYENSNYTVTLVSNNGNSTSKEKFSMLYPVYQSPIIKKSENKIFIAVAYIAPISYTSDVELSSFILNEIEIISLDNSLNVINRNKVKLDEKNFSLRDFILLKNNEIVLLTEHNEFVLKGGEFTGSLINGIIRLTKIDSVFSVIKKSDCKREHFISGIGHDKTGKMMNYSSIIAFEYKNKIMLGFNDNPQNHPDKNEFKKLKNFKEGDFKLFIIDDSFTLKPLKANSGEQNGIFSLRDFYRLSYNKFLIYSVNKKKLRNGILCLPEK